jgi:hypothetical protein
MVKFSATRQPIECATRVAAEEVEILACEKIPWTSEVKEEI